MERLSQDQRKIVYLVAAGFKNKEICKTLDLSERQVAQRMTKIFKLMNVKTRYELQAKVRVR